MLKIFRLFFALLGITLLYGMNDQELIREALNGDNDLHGLIDAGVDAHDYFNFSALMRAISREQTIIVRALLDAVSNTKIMLEGPFNKLSPLALSELIALRKRNSQKQKRCDEIVRLLTPLYKYHRVKSAAPRNKNN